jgi:hypothetical protein
MLMTFGSLFLLVGLLLLHWSDIWKSCEKTQRWNKKYHGPYGGTMWTDELSKECVYLAAFELQDSKFCPETKCQMCHFMSRERNLTVSY